MEGFNIQYVDVVSRLSGFFGFTVGKNTNLLLNVLDERDESMTGATIAYSGIDFTTSSVNSHYEIGVPYGVNTVVSISKPAYVTQTFTVNIPVGSPLVILTKKMVLAAIPYSVIIRK